MPVEKKREVAVKKPRKAAASPVVERLSAAVVQRFHDGAATRVLLDWYQRHARVLPWRVGPGESKAADPYRVWLSEVMLQQTTVATVKAYYEKFTHKWKSVDALAAAEEADVMAAWAGLGYYARARNLHACARQLSAEYGGQFPDTVAGLRALPGIGDYTAAAIAAIAFKRRAIVVDANVERVASRLGAITDPLPGSKPQIRAVVDAMTPSLNPPSLGTPSAEPVQHPTPPPGDPGDFAQAMMDLGATICTVTAPKCLLCPLANWCEAKVLGIAETLPKKAPKRAKPVRHGWLWWVERDGQILVERRPAKGLLGGMIGLPGSAWVEGDKADLPALPPDARPLDRSIQHVFTHFALNLHLVQRDAARMDEAPPASSTWVNIDKLDELGFPTLYKKAINEIKK